MADPAAPVTLPVYHRKSLFMEYNTSEGLLKLREYGRNIQMMVEYAKKLDDRDERNALVHDIVRIMANINPSVRENPDYKQVLWDHVYHLADYELDTDTEYDIPPKDSLLSRPSERMEYHEGRTRYRQYGQNVQKLVNEALAMENPEEQRELITIIVNFMKLQLHKSGEKDSISEATVCEHLKSLSKGEFNVDPETIFWFKLPAMPQQNTHRNPKHKKHGKKKKRNYR